MNKKNYSFICSNCKTLYPKWSGKCDNCNQWNCIVENEVSLSFAGKKFDMEI